MLLGGVNGQESLPEISSVIGILLSYNELSTRTAAEEAVLQVVSLALVVCFRFAVASR